MLFKKTLQEKSPNVARSVLRPAAKEVALKAAGHPAKPKVAVFITHGMGQQVPFETLDAAVEGITRAAARHGHPVKEVHAATVQLDGGAAHPEGIKTQRVQFDMRDAKG